MEQIDVANEVAQGTELAEDGTGKAEMVINFFSNLIETVGPEYAVAVIFFLVLIGIFISFTRLI